MLPVAMKTIFGPLHYPSIKQLRCGYSSMHRLLGYYYYYYLFIYCWQKNLHSFRQKKANGNQSKMEKSYIYIKA